MSEPALRELLTEVAGQAGAMPPGAAEVAIIRARRRRARRLAAVPAAALALLLVVLTGVVPGTRTATVQPAAPTATADLPDGIDKPPVWIPQVSDSPPGRAVAIFSGQGVFPLGAVLGRSQFVVAGHVPGVYRRARYPFYPGGGTLLSPDGTTVATVAEDTEGGGGPHRLDLLDLRSGSARTIPITPSNRVVPLAWAPDGGSLLVALSDEMRGGEVRDVGLVDVSTGGVRVLERSIDGVEGHRGAFSPDGRWVAYDIGGALTVRRLGGGAYRLPVRSGTWLSGPGAWTPDGRSLAVLRRTACCRPDRPASWQVEVIDARTATAQRASYAVFHGAGLRVLGWRGQSPVAELGHGVMYGDVSPTSDLTGDIRRTEVVVLPAGGSAPVVLIGAPAGVQHIDVAPGLVSAGTVGPWPRPARRPVDLAWAVGGAALAALLAVAAGGAAVVVVLRRRARRRR